MLCDLLVCCQGDISDNQHHHSDYDSISQPELFMCSFVMDLYLAPTIRPIRLHGQLPIDLPETRIKDVKVHTL
jgi:hypothetical protein